jgi:hypothetical protein
LFFVTKQAKLKDSSGKAANRLLPGGDMVVKPPSKLLVLRVL